MARKRKRGLSEDDKAAWERVTRGATPLQDLRRSMTAALPQPERDRPLPIKTPDMRPFTVGGAATAAELRDHAPPALDPLQPGSAGLDRRTAERLRKGQTPPQARLDLHGMTAERAHGALVQFIRMAHGQGLRCVLVITGKGGGSYRREEEAAFMPSRTGVLRHSVPRWLRTAPLKPLIVGVFQAHPRHGGAGALYVYLKRKRG